MVECCKVAGFMKREAVKKHRRSPLRDNAFWGRGLKSQPMCSLANQWNWEIPLFDECCEDFAVAFLNKIMATGVRSCSPDTCPKCAKDAAEP